MKTFYVFIIFCCGIKNVFDSIIFQNAFSRNICISGFGF